MQAKSDFILAFTDATANLAHVGGKGASLVRMAIAGLPVPTGFYITTNSYRRFVETNGIQPRLLDALNGKDITDPATLESVSRLIQGYFTAGCIPIEVADAISAAYSALKNVPVAVRSSATAEDLPEASFAGQQETYLNICGINAVLDSVKKCWASLWTARAIAYRAQHHICPESVALAVVVQELVFADAVGVMFTANPINGKRDEIMITATWGLGEAIVSGAVTPDTLTMSKPTGRLIRRDIAEKQVMTVRTESGTDEVPVPKSQKKKPVLTNAQAAELTKLGMEIEKLYEMPMDIEWPLPHPKAVLARGSFAEFVPEPVSPLFATLAVPIARETSIKMMSGFGMGGENSYLFEVLNDYVYIGFVFSSKLIWPMIKASFRLLGPLLKGTPQRAVVAREKFLAAVQTWQARDLAALAPSELLTGVREIFTETALYYNMAQSGTIPTAMISEATFGAFYKLLVKHKNDPKTEIFVFGTENHAMRSEKALFALAMWIKRQPELADYVARIPAEEICKALQSDHPSVPVIQQFATRFDSYLHEFGHAIYDLDFAKPTPTDAPEVLVETLKVYLTGKNNPHERQRAAILLREQAEATISKRLDPLRRKYFLQLLKWAQETAPLREDSIADVGLGHPQIRRMLGELGQRLVEGGVLHCKDDIYWLEINELDELARRLEKGERLESFVAQIQQRQAKWQAMRHIIPPNTLPEKTWMSKLYADNKQASNKIKGFGASAGKVTAQACVMLGPEDFSKMQTGDIIVAGITTLVWTPLFARASAIVTDIGGPLSHSSIVAREYGIPAVLATGVGTRRIQDGQTITVDGGAGTVELK